MRIAIIGASGFIGEKLVDEALMRGHVVDAIYRRNRIKERPNLFLHQLTIFDENAFEQAIKDADVIISAYNPGYYHVEQSKRYLEGYEAIFSVARKLNKRVIALTGATSLINYDGELVSQGFFPKPWLKALEGPDLVFEKFRGLDNVTFVSPAAELIDGKRTQRYSYHTTHLIYDDNGESRISVQDLADAIINEVESPKYQGKRFTIAYK